ncbi:ADP-ribosylglycohydrolase family protein [Microbacterium sp. S1037]|uniref:ADP-ribosylglycohydrolase family protein n=1 Tax=Microbacterium sp. S1037 TaxID=3398227 RepID=UPI003AAE9401
MAHLSPAQMDRAVGTVIVSAAGDALGSAYEFGPALPDEVTPEFGVGHFGHGAGEWTDDTSMAIPVLDELAAGRRLTDPAALERIVAAWQGWAQSALDVGAQTRHVLGRIPSPPMMDAIRTAARAVHDETGRSGGNGSLMRTGPVALGYLDRPDLTAAAAAVAQLTHWEDDNVDACALWCAAIRHGILTGELDMCGQLDVVPQDRRDRWAALIDEALVSGRHPRDFRDANGWVVRAFQGALAAVSGAAGPLDAIERAVRGGNDTDTVAAIAGSLAGAVWGADALPDSHTTVLHGWPGIDAAELARRARLAVGASAVSAWG